MNGNVALWLFFRFLRWGLWIAFFVLSFYVRYNRSDVLTILNQLPKWIEFAMYGLACAAVFAGFMELMMREKTGLSRPPFLRMPRGMSTEASHLRS
jgi:membrane-bound acyltransferase YfiQ involved in biofilm formation